MQPSQSSAPNTPFDPLPEVPALDTALRAELLHALDNKTKPRGSLGGLETLALQLGLIQRSLHPVIRRPVLILFAGDHGLVEEGVSPFPQAVTGQMVRNFLAGGAAVNVFSRLAGLELELVNAGVAGDLSALPGVIDLSLGRGTRNFVRGSAMNPDQTRAALAAGAARAAYHVARGSNVIAFGEMGIGNSSSAACLMSRFCDLPIDACVGRGTGLNDAGLARKREVLARALARHAPSSDPIQTLAAFGGFEIAMIAGAMLGAAAAGMTLVIDGFIVGAALLAARALAPAVRDYCVFAHRSHEQGHRRMLEELRAEPLLDLDLRLGEGSGAALALPLVRAAAAMLSEMASFEAARVSGPEADAA